MLQHDLDLRATDIQLLSSLNGIAAFFASLGYAIDRVPQTLATMGIGNATLRSNVQQIERLVSYPTELEVYFIKLNAVTVANTQALARAFKDLDAEFMLVLTDDSDRIDFVLLERIRSESTRASLSVRPLVLTVERRTPSPQALRVLRRFSFTEPDPLAQYDKLLSAYTVAEWSAIYYNNRALFSDYYLNERLPDSPEWGEAAQSIVKTFRATQPYMTGVREKLSRKTEAVAFKELYQPLLQLMGFRAEPGKQGADHLTEPDFRLYTGDAAQPAALMLAYAWNRNLDASDSARDTENGDEVPGAKVVTLLDTGEADWAIVTNGKLWRLYGARAHSRATNYYEIDLEEAISGDNALDGQDRGLAFLYWWLFFRADAFVPHEQVRNGKAVPLTFLARMIEDSEDYAKALGERLKNRIFEDIFPHFAQGLIVGLKQTAADDTETVRGYTEADLNLVFHATLTLLYRLMFLLYAESRNLLPIQEARGYYEISLKKLKDEIAEKGGAISDDAVTRLRRHYTNKYNSADSTLWERLQTLFAVIDQGNAAYNMPQYNGGLFVTRPDDIAAMPEGIEKQAAQFLIDVKVPDQYIALGLDFLARDLDNKTKTLVAIDYKSLGVRHLGSIYEGLLEFKLAVAAQKMAVVMEDKVEKIIPYDEAKKKALRIKTIPRNFYGEHFYAARGDHPGEIVYTVGQVYLINTKQERKATGSYYTPDYIVKYIVQHTVGPVLDEKFAGLTPRLREAGKKYYEAKKRAEGFIKSNMTPDDPEKTWNDSAMRALAHDVFDLKVLDPAMGSGHFLVEVVDYVTDRIIKFLQGHPTNPVAAALRETRTDILRNLANANISIDPARLTDVALLKRQVLKRCVYGVDLNPMAVELAKVSLWLDAFTLGAPLSFLDHHLKCGNSLIGSRIKDVQDALDQPGQLSLLAQSQFTGLMLATSLMAQVGDLPDVTIEQSHKSKDAYAQAYKALEPFKRILDVYTSRWFGNAPTKGKGKNAQTYDSAIEFLRRDDTQGWIKDPASVTFGQGDYMKVGEIAATATNAAKEKRFFHWELEFPEVFFIPGSVGALRQSQQDAGFDAVVGNPPYVTAMGDKFTQSDKRFFNESYSTVEYQLDLYPIFMEVSVGLTCVNGNVSFIVPNVWTKNIYSLKLREYILSSSQLRLIASVPPNTFAASVDTCIFMLHHASTTNANYTFKTVQLNPDGIQIPLATLTQADVLQSPNSIISLNTVGNSSIVLRKIDSVSDALESTSQITRGVNPYDKYRGHTPEQIVGRVFHSTFQKDKTFVPEIRGGNVGRYLWDWDGTTWISYGEWLAAPRSPEFFEGPRIVLREIVSERLYCAYIDEHKITDRSLYIAKSSILSALYYCALINSSTLVFYFRSTNDEFDEVFPKIRLHQFKSLPIRHIEFYTPTPRRAELADKGRKLYQRCLTEGHACGLEFVDHHMSLNETDVIHDLLAFLAQQMIDLNKSKQAEMKRFLGWLEATIRIKPGKDKSGWDVIAGKTDILEYLGDYQKGEPEKPFQQIRDRLIQNRTKLGVDVYDSALQDRIEAAYEKSLGVLRPIKAQLATTDALIDQVVYRLYGLTEDEIKIVEGQG